MRVINFRQWGQACLPGRNYIYVGPIIGGKILAVIAELLFSSKYLMHCSLVLPQIEDTFEDFLTKVASLRLLRPVLHPDVSGQVASPHLLHAMGTAGHHTSYK